MAGKQQFTTEERLDSKFTPDVNGCWIWTGSRIRTGYGVLGMKCADGKWRPRLAHRLMYERYICEIPAGLVLDHLCRVRACVNPRHLEPVTPLENQLRGHSPWVAAQQRSSCIRGHPYNRQNLRRNKKTGSRYCRECRRQQENARIQRLRDAGYRYDNSLRKYVPPEREND